ncbi:MAG: phosphoribosylanthranilate isomerase [Micavibrio aeruginosavorus]|uniref:N-(5'-phosphoribosyl)anthranilate isomerase n=1 Tax=Micavibrio aeruginosavorus TaxID=349221 RepID=A0A7T5R2C2_9BACT|nr:MAG: phosphoribosylanthranilate isomerase [Micavibrio aeruginosavorus]
MTAIKICGITGNEALIAAGGLAVHYVGFMMWPLSPRALSIDQAAFLSVAAPENLKIVGVFVNPTNEELETAIAATSFDLIQLHGDEDARRVADVRSRFGLPVIKALRIAAKGDLIPLADIEHVADYVLFDTKVDPKISVLPGGTGLSFDWQILSERKMRRPWMLSGGLNAENIGRALSILSPDAVDVSSGVEDRPGIKNTAKMKEFVQAVRTMRPQSPLS